MRDPLRRVSVRYKLAFTFLGVCFLAFGVGGYLVSTSARQSLEREILTRLSFQSQFYATALEGGLRTLASRARDFASDGYIRTRYEELDASGLGDADLRQHLRENKLVLEPAFANLALADASGEQIFVADPADSAWTRTLPQRAFGEEDWFSGLIPPEAPDALGGPPSTVIATPLRSLTGDRRIGTLLVKIRSGVWIAGAFGSIRSGVIPAGSELSLRLEDAHGRTLEIPREFVEAPVPAPDSHTAQTGSGLRVRPASNERAGPAVRGILTREFPIALSGWSLATALRTQDALTAVSGLQARFLIVGVLLTAAACVILLFPMRFLARPIARLNDAARHIREGDFSARVPVESTDEIGELSSSFNRMAEAVEERAEKIQASARDLRRERDRLNAVILSMRDGLMVLDAAGRPEVWNAAAEPLKLVVQNGGLELSAHRNCQQVGNGNGNGNGTDPDEGTGVDSACMRCLFEPTAPPRSCLVDAGPYVYEIHSTRLASEVDGRSGRVLVARDVTDRAAEDEREIHQERLAVLGEVAAVMAHELNNPLAAIRMFTQMIESRLEPESPLREDVTVIQRNTETCARTIRELLDYATGATPEVGPVDVHANLREVASFLRAFRERKDCELTLELEAEDPVVVGDEVQLRQVFVNLVLNALQAVGKGQVCVRTRLEDTHLEVDVVDDGPGIPDDVGDGVFKPFYTTKRRGSGTGLGLSTARRITEIQGGGLELVDGRAGHTTFRVRLLRG